jgi:hypothetical protein
MCISSLGTGLVHYCDKKTQPNYYRRVETPYRLLRTTIGHFRPANRLAKYYIGQRRLVRPYRLYILLTPTLLTLHTPTHLRCR